MLLRAVLLRAEPCARRAGDAESEPVGCVRAARGLFSGVIAGTPAGQLALCRCGGKAASARAAAPERLVTASD